MTNQNVNPAVPTNVTAHTDYHGNVIFTVNPVEQRVNVTDYHGNIINVTVSHYGE